VAIYADTHHVVNYSLEYNDDINMLWNITMIFSDDPIKTSTWIPGNFDPPTLPEKMMTVMIGDDREDEEA